MEGDWGCNNKMVIQLSKKYTIQLLLNLNSILIQLLLNKQGEGIIKNLFN